jgi:hypothetical protein
MAQKSGKCGNASVNYDESMSKRKSARTIAGGSSSDRKRSRPIRAFSATPNDGQRPCRALAEDPGRTQPQAAYPLRRSSNASGLPGRNSARILEIRASFQRDNLRLDVKDIP